MLSPLYAQCDKDAARAALQAAEATESHAQRLGILDQALTACPSFKGWYMKGRTLLALNQPAPAAQALQEAHRIASEDRFRGAGV